MQSDSPPSARWSWLYSPRFDLSFILAPPFLATAAVLLFPQFFEHAEVSPYAWLLLVVGIDVAHVYSTLYRTYFDPEEFHKRESLYIAIPLLCWFAGILLYSFGEGVFWRVLAYLAVYHFIRQQYGILRLYTRKEEMSAWGRRLDAATIYLATLFPLLYWHVTPRKFSWFKEGDFFSLPFPMLLKIGAAIYFAVLCAYVVKEAWVFRTRGWLNVGKQLVVLGTILSWYVGIVLFNGDMAFTVTNVVCHGVPYIALVWVYGRKKWSRARPNARAFVARAFDSKVAPIFVGLLLLLAAAEEFLWDSFVWQEHCQLFGGCVFPRIEEAMLLTIVVPLLAVPQATHYVLDAFIWRIRSGEHTVREVL